MSTRPNLHLDVGDHDLKLTREEFAEAVFEEPWRFERVKGRLFVMPPAGPDHHRPTNRLRSRLGAYELSHPEIVDCIFSEAWVAIDDTTDRIADIAIYLNAAKARGLGPRRVPDIVFEIVSGGGEDRKRDYVDKRADYLRAGVKEYVIIDRFERRATVLRRTRGRFVESHLTPNDAYRSPFLPGLRIALSEIL